MQLLAQYFQRLPKQTRAIIATCLFGLVAGSAAVLFQYTVQEIFAYTYARFQHETTTRFMIESFIMIMVCSLIVGWLLNSFCKSASGSGIPQLKLAYWKEFGYVPFRVVWVKYVAGALSLGGGCSLGREGPSVQLAGGVASHVAGWTGESKQRRRLAAASGAAAGLAAAFNTPVAAVTFVLEEILQDLNSRYLGSVLLASVLGALVAHGFLGPQPAFTLGSVEHAGWISYAMTPIVAALASLAGMCFQHGTIRLRAVRKGFEHVPDWVRPAFGGFITWVLGCGVFYMTRQMTGEGSIGVFGLGYIDLTKALTEHYEWKIAAVLLVAKLIATISCYGFGGCGGIFSPTLFFGGMCGVAVAGLVGLVMPIKLDDSVFLAVVGMSACMGAVVRAPVTSILIVFEMTHEFALVPPLMIGTLISQAISRKLAKENFYEELLKQDGHQLEHVIPPRDLQTWQQLPVSAIANFQPVLLKDLSLDTIKTSIKQHPYLAFPVIQDKKLAGVLTRAEAEKALRENRPPKLEPAVSCRPNESIRQLQLLLIESTTGVVVLTDRQDGRVIGLVTLHDLFRAEVSIAEGSEG
ncbi:CBS domain-containing protein [bacterium]|nr:CBS domain-containing protein [bacterium]